MTPAKRVRQIVLVVALVAGGFALLGQLSQTLVDVSSLGGVLLSFIAGLVIGGTASRTWSTAATWGGLGGFTNAFVGIGTAMLVRHVDPFVLVAGSVGGTVVGALGGVIGWASIGRRR